MQKNEQRQQVFQSIADQIDSGGHDIVAGSRSIDSAVQYMQGLFDTLRNQKGEQAWNTLRRLTATGVSALEQHETPQGA